MIFKQKGAMFGLDARIALAIFGALSVISGAALYSAIQNSRVVSIITEMDEIGKAVTAYLLDTGTYPAANTVTTLLNADGLVSDDARVGWNGPYLSFESQSTPDDTLIHAEYTSVEVTAKTNNAWSDHSLAAEKCIAGTTDPCSVFVCYTNIPTDIINAIEERVDGTAGTASTGKFRSTGNVGCMQTLTFDESAGAAS